MRALGLRQVQKEDHFLCTRVRCACLRLLVCGGGGCEKQCYLYVHDVWSDVSTRALSAKQQCMSSASYQAVAAFVDLVADKCIWEGECTT
jgi:hypothetical protein